MQLKLTIELHRKDKTYAGSNRKILNHHEQDDFGEKFQTIFKSILTTQLYSTLFKSTAVVSIKQGMMDRYCIFSACVKIKRVQHR